MSDLISRAEVLSLFPNAFYDGLASQIKALPSAERSGEWIPKEDYGGFDYYQCSNCKEDFYFEIEPSKSGYTYCPNCGARMENTK